MAPLVLASLYRGLKTLTYQIGDGSPISGHGPLWILKLWIHAYFVFYPQFGANELKERLTSGSEENFSCYVDVLRLSPRTTCSFQECFEAFYTKETIETFTPFSERRFGFGPALFRFDSSYPDTWLGSIAGRIFGMLLVGESALAAEPEKDCWTGDPDEHLLRSVDHELTRIKAAKEELSEKTVERARTLNLGLPGSPSEQQKDISLILDNHLDDFDLEKRGRKVQDWVEKQFHDSDSEFWLMIVHEIIKLHS